MVVDTGFTGDLVCGESRLAGLRSCFSDVGFTEQPQPSKARYVFGEGEAVASRTFDLNLRSMPYRLDVVPGDLPVLAGQKCLKSCRASVSFEGDVPRVTRRVGGKREVVSTLTEPGADSNSAGGLIQVSLRNLVLVGTSDADSDGDAGGSGSGQERIEKHRVEKGGLKLDLPFSKEFIERVHKHSHAKPNRLCKFLISTTGKLSPKQRKNLFDLCVSVYKECRGCSVHGNRTKPGTALRTPKSKNAQGWLDVLTIDHKNKIKCLLIVDEGTRDIAGCVVEKCDSLTLFNSYLLNWAAIHGPHAFLCGDGDGAFTSDLFRDLCLQYGIVKHAGPAESSESFGLIERQIETVRLATDRLSASADGPKTFNEWRVAIALVINGIRNEVIVGGTTASERSMGSRTSLFSNLLQDMRATPPSKERLCGGEKRGLSRVLCGVAF